MARANKADHRTRLLSTSGGDIDNSQFRTSPSPVSVSRGGQTPRITHLAVLEEMNSGPEALDIPIRYSRSKKRLVPYSEGTLEKLTMTVQTVPEDRKETVSTVQAATLEMLRAFRDQTKPKITTERRINQNKWYSCICCCFNNTDRTTGFEVGVYKDVTRSLDARHDMNPSERYQKRDIQAAFQKDYLPVRDNEYKKLAQELLQTRFQITIYNIIQSRQLP